MNLKSAVCASALTAGVGVAGLFGLGLGTASADPGQPCGVPNTPTCQGQQNNDQQHNDQQHNGHDWQSHGIDQGRQDHQPFNYNGQQVQPLPAGNGAGWGFWFFGQWIPL